MYCTWRSKSSPAKSPVCIRKHNTNIKAKKKETKIKHSFVQITCQPVIRQISLSSGQCCQGCNMWRWRFQQCVFICFWSNPEEDNSQRVCVFNPREFGCYGAISKVKSSINSLSLSFVFLRCFRNLKRKCWGFSALIREKKRERVCVFKTWNTKPNIVIRRQGNQVIELLYPDVFVSGRISFGI